MKLSAVLPEIRSRIEAGVCNRAIGNLVGLLFRDHLPCGDCVIDASGPGIAPESKAAILFGLYERSEVRFVERWLNRDLHVVELGASIGVASCHIACLLARIYRSSVAMQNLRTFVPKCERSGLHRNTSGGKS
jgi:hypothetical protein